MRNWVAGGVGVLVCVSTIMAEIPVWAIKEWVSPQSPPILSGAGGIYKEKEFYYMGLDGDLNRGLYAYDYFTETSTLVFQTEEITYPRDLSDKYIVYSGQAAPRDLWLFDGTTYRNILPYDASRWFQAVKISDDYVVWQHEGGSLGQGIFLYNITTGAISQLDDPDNRYYAEIPDIDFPYVTWEDGFDIDCSEPHFPGGKRGAIQIYNLQTGMKSNSAEELPGCFIGGDQSGVLSYPYVVFERIQYQWNDVDEYYERIYTGILARDLRSGSTIPISETHGGLQNYGGHGTSMGNVAWEEYSRGEQKWYLYFWDGSQRVVIPAEGSVTGFRMYGDNLRFNVGSKWYIALAEADTDGDGLPDSWETKGIDINNDGIVDLDLPALGADPRHKDLFVEVDRMAGVPFQRSALDMVRTAFANAPVSNPDGLNGIDLHIQIDDIVPFQEYIDDEFTDFRAIKDQNWGTVEERTHATNAENILKAKKRAFRYCLFANKFPSGSVGRGEMPGNDFVVAMGGLPAAIQTEHELATTFMHELGHNLGLNEGGGDDILFKPNYVSVMNYGFGEFEEDGTGDLLIPDFSREVMLPLDESNLDETIGIVSRRTPDVWSFFGLTDPNGVHQGIEPVLLNSQPCDWNGNYDLTEIGVEMDLTWLYPHDPNYNPQTPGQILNGYDDWANLQPAIGTTGAFEDRVVANLEVQPMTVEVRMWLREQVPHRPMLADVTGDRRIDLEDWAAFALQWRREKCGSCGGADLTGDGSVMMDDLAIQAQRWLKGI